MNVIGFPWYLLTWFSFSDWDPPIVVVDWDKYYFRIQEIYGNLENERRRVDILKLQDWKYPKK